MASAEERPSASSLTTLYTSLVELSADSIVVFAANGTIRHMNPAAGSATGWDPDAAAGRNILELLHPDDVERTLRDVGVHAEPGAPPGSSSYRVRAADGSWLPIQVTTAGVTDGSGLFLAAFCRVADVSQTQALFGLLRGSSAVEALTPVLDMFNRSAFGSRVAISWLEDERLHQVGTDVPAELAGADDSPESPWGMSRREGRPQIAHDLSALDPGRRANAERLGLGAYWVQPVIAEGADVPAVITVWTRTGGPDPEYHSSGMAMAMDFVELILRWTRQVRLLNEAAHRDVLTGLANRKAFFDALNRGGSGAVLYCDLDRFKPVNDEHGHRAGDELLRAVARRIERCVRSGDLVARLGGDEFAVLCAGATAEQAADLAERIRVAVEQPFQVVVARAQVGISIGLAHTDRRLGDAVLESADRALYRAKAEGGSAVRR
ncbi:MAG: diguanylate cyclase domain-containing protein [Actinomycetota bacterium]